MIAGRDFTAPMPRRAESRHRQRGVREEVQPRTRRRRQADRARAAASKLDTEIVGLVQNAKYSEVKDEIPPLFFRPYRQDSRSARSTSTCATAREPEPILSTIPQVVAGLDRQPAGRESADAAAAGARERVPRPLHQRVVRGLRRAGDAARGGRASTGCSPTRWRSARGRSGCGWRSAPRRRACAA